jgi:chemotaxis protein MotB
MHTKRRLVLAMSWIVFFCSQAGFAQAEDARSVKMGDAALTFAAGSIQKSSQRDGFVNLITGDNQTTGNRMLLGKRDVFYLNLNNPADVTVGDLYTVYRRVRKVFHPATNEYLGFTTIRLAVVRVLAVDHALATVEAILAYGMVSPGDLVMRFTSPPAVDDALQAGNLPDVAGMIVELQADMTMMMVSQSNVVYLDRGREDGLKQGDLMDVYRQSAGLPSRKIGQLKVLATEDRTATAKVVKANTLILRGDRYKLTGYQAPLAQPLDPLPIPSDVVASKLKVQDAAGQSRINLGELKNFLHYDSGEAVIKPASYNVLDQLIEYFRTTGDERLIRVEGHADNVEIGPSLKSRYASNWDLSKARANGVARYLVEKGGIDSARLSSVGYGESRPAAPNVTEEGRTKNRRVEILLYAPPAGSPASNTESSGAPLASGGDPSNLSASGALEQPATSADVSEAASTAPGSAAPSGIPTAEASDPGAFEPEGISAPEVSATQDPMLPIKPTIE